MSKQAEQVFSDIDRYLGAFDELKKPRPQRIALSKKQYKTLLGFYNKGKKEKEHIHKVPNIDGREVFIYEP